jgi:ribosomal protein S18 acetylase RimI-like enzyme
MFSVFYKNGLPVVQQRFIHIVTTYQEEHFLAVKRIAMANFYRLVGGSTNDEMMFTAVVKPLLKAESCLVSLVDNKPVGFVTFVRLPKTLITFQKDFGKIEHLATDEANRKDGHGTSLVNRVLKQFEEQGMEYATLQVNHLNLFDFYKRFGFRPVWVYSSKTNTIATLSKKLGPPSTHLSKRVQDALIVRYVAHRQFFNSLPWSVTIPYLLFLWGLANLN